MLFLGVIEQTNQIEREREREREREGQVEKYQVQININKIEKKKMVRMHEKCMSM